jgi:uncharacterized protein
VFPTERCQLRCEYCYYFGYARQRGARDMDEETALAAMDFLAERARREGTRRVHVGWFGGEPLLRLSFIRWFMETARRRHPDVEWSHSATTNAVVLASRRAAEEVKRLGMTSLIVSVDGVGGWHDRHRKFPDGRGSWPLVERAIRNLVELGIPFTARMTLTPENLGGAVEAVKWLVEHGVRNIYTGIVEENVWDEESLWRLRRVYSEIADYLIGKLLEGVPISWGQFHYGADLVFNDQPMGEHEHCGQLGNSMAIYVDGSVYSCHRAVGIEEFKAGDVFSGLDPERAGRLSRMFSRSKAVEVNNLRGYPFVDRTHFGCLLSNYEARGDIHRANVPLLKAYDESSALAAVKLFLAGRAAQSRLIYDIYFRRFFREG